MAVETLRAETRAPDELDRGEHRFAALYENAPGFIAASRGPGHVFTFANASYRQFVGRQALLGKSVAEAMPELSEQGIITILDEVYRTGQPFLGNGMPLTIWNAEAGASQQRYVDVVYQPLLGTNGAVTGLFCEGHDVTDKHEALATIAMLQAQMIHASRVSAVDTMAATLAHELYQPLCAIGNYTSGALDELPEQSVARYIEALQGIDAASRRAAAIITHLRELTKRGDPDHTEFDIKTTIEKCVGLVQASTSGKVGFAEDIPAGLITNADEIQVDQVIINLLVNACEAIQGEGQITIRGWVEGNDIIVSIADSGPGVDREAAKSLFMWSRSTKVDGMGLGLAICRTIIDLHGGRIWLEQSTPGGSEFRFSLPSANLVAIT